MNQRFLIWKLPKALKEQDILQQFESINTWKSKEVLAPH